MLVASAVVSVASHVTAAVCVLATSYETVELEAGVDVLPPWQTFRTRASPEDCATMT